MLTFSLSFWTKAPVSTNVVGYIVNWWSKSLLALEDYTDFDTAWPVKIKSCILIQDESGNNEYIQSIQCN